ncbi:unnamed protein product [Coccothraustes coccothraustes]
MPGSPLSRAARRLRQRTGRVRVLRSLQVPADAGVRLSVRRWALQEHHRYRARSRWLGKQQLWKQSSSGSRAAPAGQAERGRPRALPALSAPCENLPSFPSSRAVTG